MAALLAVALAATAARPLAAQTLRDVDDLEARPNLIGLSLGGTTTTDNINLSAGVDVEHRFARWGAGAFGEWLLGGDEREWFVAPALFAHPANGLRLAVAPGVQRWQPTDETQFVVRLAGDVEVAMGDRLSIVPRVALDLVEGSVSSIFVFGAGVGYRF